MTLHLSAPPSHTRNRRPDSSPKRRLPAAATPTAAGLLALAISLIGIGTPSIWYDEAATITAATRSWAQLADMIGSVDAVHAVYYALMHVVFDIFGYSPVSLRVPSALAVGAAAALTVLLGRELARPRLGAIAGFVFALLPRTTWMGTEGRSYAITATLAVLLSLLLVRAIRDSSTRRWLLYGAVVVVSCLVFLYLALIVVAHAITMLGWAVARRDSRARVRAWIVTTTAATIVVTPFALTTMAQSGQLHWLDPLGKHTLRQVLVGQWFSTSDDFAKVGWILLAVGAVALVRRFRRNPVLALVLLPALVVPTLALLAVTEWYLPIYTPRYLSMCLPFVALVIAAAIDAAAGPSRAVWRARAVFGVAAVLLVTLAVPQIIEQRQPEAKEATSWSEVANRIALERSRDGVDSTTAIIYGGVQFHPIATARVIAYSYPEAFVGTIDVTLDTPAAETGKLWETTQPLADSLDRLADADVVYLVSSFSRDVRESTTSTLAEAGWTLTDSWDYTDVHVLRYTRN